MKGMFVILLAIPILANSAEFTLNGKIIKSSKVVIEAKCAGYSLLVKEERYPEEARGQVPVGSGIEGYLGDDLIANATAYIQRGSEEKLIPSVAKKYQKAGKLSRDDDRVYIPRQGYCLNENTFLLSLDSGGNCSDCEVLIKYRINKDGSISDAGFPSGKEAEKAMAH